MKNCRCRLALILPALICLVVLFMSFVPGKHFDWEIGPFERVDSANPILIPSSHSTFVCPVQGKQISWEAEHTFNPGAIVHQGKVYLFYRAEDDFGKGIGNHTSRLGLAESEDGIHFQRLNFPVLFPDTDDQKVNEWPGGCEDPRIVETEQGTFIMTYTQWNRKVASLGIATSTDLLHWKKHGYAFEGHMERRWSKSGAIVCRQENDRLIATKILGKYWMYWGEGCIYAAVSDDLISWQPILDSNQQPLAILQARQAKYDSELVEAGPPAILTKDGIVLLYNGKNSVEKGDPNITPNSYSAGQLLLDPNDPVKVLDRTENCFLTPKRSYEMHGQYKGGTVFIQGLVHFRGNWLLYYGMADSTIGVAKTKY